MKMRKYSPRIGLWVATLAKCVGVFGKNPRSWRAWLPNYLCSAELLSLTDRAAALREMNTDCVRRELPLTAVPAIVNGIERRYAKSLRPMALADARRYLRVVY